MNQPAEMEGENSRLISKKKGNGKERKVITIS